MPGFALAEGTNTITAVAVDRAGNEASTTIAVTREPDLVGVRIGVTGGNAQRGEINATLATPLSVRLTRADGGG